jgi:hypothetical protein
MRCIFRHTLDPLQLASPVCNKQAYSRSSIDFENADVFSPAVHFRERLLGRFAQ